MESGNQEITRRAPLMSSGQLLAELHARIRAENLCSDAMLNQIVEAARILTRAQGAAIAMRQDDSVICMATAGTMAPGLGSHLQADSGISAQCLRTGAPICCNDTSTDARVDREVCSGLGLRSLVAAPIGKWPTVSGVLEVFSATPRAFDDAEVQLLAELADLVDSTPRDTRAPEKVAEHCENHRACLLGQECPGLKVARVTRELSNSRLMSKGRLILVTAAIVLVFVWLGLRVRAARPNASAAAPPPRSTAGAPSAGAQSSETPPVEAAVGAPPADQAHEPSTPPASALRPSPVLSRSTTTNPSDPSDGVLMAKTTEETRPAEHVIIPEPKPEAPSAANASAPAENPTSPPPQPTVEVAVAPPLDIIRTDNKALLNRVLSTVTASPLIPAVKSSTGITGGTIERIVRPAYPAEAIKLKREGSVVLEAVITKAGTVRGLKVISGDSLLARAALDAVAKWRYRPFALNGQTIQRTTEITVEFKLP